MDDLGERRFVVVTGAAGWLGKHIIKALDADNFSVVAWIRVYSQEFESFISDLSRLSRNNHHALVVNLEDLDSIKLAATETKKITKRCLHGLINNAGIAEGAPALMTKSEMMERVMRVNFHAPVSLIQEFAKPMIAQKFGRIINVCSIQGLIAERGYLSYGSSKAALIHASRIFAQELCDTGITVNSVCPGVIEGSSMASAMDELSRNRIKAMSNSQTGVSVDQVVELIKFLLRPEASGVNGQVLRVDGTMPF